MDIFDPTGLTSVRARLGRETARRWVRTARDVKRAIIQDDVLGIGPKAPRMAQPVADKAQMFKRWVDEQLMMGIVGRDADWLEAPIRKASSWGAVGVSMVYDFDPDESRDDQKDALREIVDAQANLGFLIPGGIGTRSSIACHAASVTSLATICEKVSDMAHASVSNALLSRARPNQVAKLVDQAFGEGLKRSRLLAEHAITQAYSQGTLDSLEDRGVTHVGTISEHSMGRMDRLSSIWGRDAEPMTAAGIAFKDRYGQLLFLHRTDGAGWAFPGGGVDAPETLENGAVREAQEELGGAPLGALKKVWRSVGYGVDYTTFEQAVEEPFEPAALNHEHDDWQWAAPEDAPHPLHPGVREMLRGRGLMDDEDDLEDDSVEVTGEDGRKYRVIKNEMGGWSVYANDAVDALFDDARKAPQPQHPKTGKFVKGFVAAREGRRSKLSGQFRKQGLTPQEQRREELREMRFSRVTGRLDVVTQGDDRVCDVCDEIADGGPYTINQARGLIPAHPHCRCIFKAASRSSIRDCERVLDFDADEPGRQGEEAGWTASNLS